MSDELPEAILFIFLVSSFFSRREETLQHCEAPETFSRRNFTQIFIDRLD